MKYFLGLVVSLGITSMLMASSANAVGVNDFTISNYDIHYQLSQNDENRSQLKTVETITAQFPQIDQNHGLERAIPQSYDGHPTGLKIQSVTDESGSPQPYTTYDSNDNRVVRIGDKNVYAHGRQTYVITYTQQDVTRFFSNTNSDEFYWDTNGVEWTVPIQRLSVKLEIAESLRSSLTDRTACYYGVSGSSDRCQLTKSTEGYSATILNMNRNENVSLAIGFKPNTFAVYKKSVRDTLFEVYITTLVIGFIFAFISIYWLSFRWHRWSDRAKEVGIVVPEYIPPKGVSVTAAASIGTVKGSAFTAQLLDFAVRHYIKIYQTRDKGFLRSAEYDIEIVRDISTLQLEEQEILKDIFNSKVEVGSRLALKSLKNNTSLYGRIQDNDKKLKELVRGEYKLRQKDVTKSGWFKKVGWVFLIVGLVLLNPFLVITAIVAFCLGYTLWPLTDTGLALSRYLQGLKVYIQVAEVERIRMLQSSEGAQKVGSANVNDTSQLVKLYERVLPYAVLFGQEKDWNKQIGQYYEQMGSSPEWYSGSNAVFSAAAFSSSINSFSNEANYASANNSSSGGSGGGGFSGGGGGGGGGGGW
jgi:uncharacterized membrane protein YgcG